MSFFSAAMLICLRVLIREGANAATAARTATTVRKRNMLAGSGDWLGEHCRWTDGLPQLLVLLRPQRTSIFALQCVHTKE